MEVFIGTICAFPYNFAPVDWLACNGGTVQLSQYQALAALLNTQYGGNGQTTIGIPNLQGKLALGADGNNYINGDTCGSIGFAATEANLPPHNHQISASLGCNMVSTSTSPVNNFPSALGAGAHLQRAYAPYTNVQSTMTPQATIAVQSTGSGTGQMINTMSPYQVSLYCIATMGEFPLRG